MNFVILYRGNNQDGFPYICFGLDNDHKIDIVFYDDHIWIEDIFVLRSSRRNGIGRALINEVENFACESGLRLIKGNLVPGAGISIGDLSFFWTSLGFKINDNKIEKAIIC